MAELKQTTIEVTPPRVRVAVGYTKNMGDFESLRYDVAVEASPINGENTSETYNRVSEFVEKKLVEKMTELEAELKSS
jgi:hypothetical protein